MKQPVLGLMWTAICLALGGIVFYSGVFAMAMDPLQFMVRVPIPFIFGTIIVLNMLQGWLFTKYSQPWKGILNAVAAAAIGTRLALVYGALAPSISGELAPGPPGNDFERWLASALLGVTFPFLIFYAEFFEFWPLKQKAAQAAELSQQRCRELRRRLPPWPSIFRRPRRVADTSSRNRLRR